MFDFVGGFLAGLAFWPIVYWGLIVIPSLALFVLIERTEREVLIGVSLICIAVGIYFLTNGAPIQYVIEYPFIALMWVGGYFLVGAIWSLWKWFLKAGEYREKLDAEIERFLQECKNAIAVEAKQRGAGEQRQQSTLSTLDIDKALSEIKNSIIPDQFIPLWHGRRRGHSIDLAPRIRDHKAAVMSWIAYWPWSMLNYLFFRLLSDFFDFVWRIVEHIWQFLLKAYEAITNFRFRDIDQRLLDEKFSEESK